MNRMSLLIERERQIWWWCLGYGYRLFGWSLSVVDLLLLQWVNSSSLEMSVVFLHDRLIVLLSFLRDQYRRCVGVFLAQELTVRFDKWLPMLRGWIEQVIQELGLGYWGWLVLQVDIWHIPHHQLIIKLCDVSKRFSMCSYDIHQSPDNSLEILHISLLLVNDLHLLLFDSIILFKQ